MFHKIIIVVILCFLIQYNYSEDVESKSVSSGQKRNTTTSRQFNDQQVDHTIKKANKNDRQMMKNKTMTTLRRETTIDDESTGPLITTTTTTAETIELNDEPLSFKNTSTFSCYGKQMGYYADIKLSCRVYHFCTQVDSFGEVTYQRMSYICLEGSVFDQKDLNCVLESDLKTPCEQAESEYETSNKVYDPKEASQPSMSDSLAANFMMNPLTRMFAG